MSHGPEGPVPGRRGPAVTPTRLTRRRFIVMAGATALALPACGRGDRRIAVSADDPAVAARESALAARNAAVRRFSVTAGPIELDLAGRAVDTWGYSSGPVRAAAGEILEVTLRNDLPEDTTIHWHGIALRNDMDGVHDLTQGPVRPGDTFTYRFLVPDSGTHFFHPHTGLQLDRALYEPLVIDDPDEAGEYDVDHVLVFDDWLEGTPEEAFAALSAGDMGGTDMGGTDMGATEMRGMDMAESELLGGHAGDIAYAMHLTNGRPPEDRPTFEVPAGGRARLRLVNAASDTAYRVAVGGLRLTVTHADGFPVEPVEVDALLLGMAERYDVVVEAGPGAYPIVAVAEGKEQYAAAVLRAGPSEAPAVDVMPAELDGRLLAYADLVPTDAVRLGRRSSDADFTVELTGDEADYTWGINGKPFAETDPFEIEEGQRVRVLLRNRSTMWHPMHLHGHTFALEDGGARKDTVIVRPDEEIAFTFEADNPGQWMLHCHNTYHLEAGMASVVSYVR